MSPELTSQVIAEHLHRVTTSPTFARSPQAARFLAFVVEEALAERGDAIKAYRIGVEALGISGPRSDPDGGARMQAGRTRKLLASYYQGPGRHDAVRIVLPTGSYQPCFELIATQSDDKPTEPCTVIVEPYSIHGTCEEWTRLGGFFREEMAFALSRFDGIRVHAKDNTFAPGALNREGASSTTALNIAVHLQVRGQRMRSVVSLRHGTTGACLWHSRFDTDVIEVDTLSFGEFLANRVAPALADPVLGAIPRYLRTQPQGSLAPIGPGAFHKFLLSGSSASLTQALRELQVLLVRDPENVQQRIAFAHANAAMYALCPDDRQDYLEVAEEQIRGVLSSLPDSPHARLVKGFVHFHRRESEAARHELGLSIRGNPLQMHTVGNAGLLLALLGDWQEGLNWVDATYARFPDAPGFLHLAHCAHLFLENGNPEEAYRHSELFDTPDVAWSPILRAVCLAVLGRRYEASRAVSELLNVDPEFPKHARTYLSGFLYAESLVEAFASALREAGLRIGPAKGRPPTRRAQTSSDPQSNELDVRVGLLHSLSGTMAICERHLVHAAQLAIDEINAAGGVLGRQIAPVVEDGESNPEAFARKARKLILQDGVVSLFGCWTSACRKAVRPIVEHHNLLLWYPVQYEGLERSRNIVYTGSCLNQQIEPATHWAIAQGKRRFFLVGSDYVFPRTANYLIRALVEGAGCQIVGEEYRPLGVGGFREVVERIRRVSPDLVFNTINGADNLEFFAELSNAGIRAAQCPVMSFSLSELELPDLQGGASGHFACWGYFQSVDAPENRELLRRFRERYGEHEVLSDPAVTAYAQVHLWKQVVESARSFDTEAMLRAIVGSELSLAGDTLEVRSNNHVKRRALIGRIRPDNQFDVVWGSDEAIAPRPWLGVEESNLDSQALILETMGSVPDMMHQQAELEREIARRLPASSAPKRLRSDAPPPPTVPRG